MERAESLWIGKASNCLFVAIRSTCLDTRGKRKESFRRDLPSSTQMNVGIKQNTLYHAVLSVAGRGHDPSPWRSLNTRDGEQGWR